MSGSHPNAGVPDSAKRRLLIDAIKAIMSHDHEAKAAKGGRSVEELMQVLHQALGASFLPVLGLNLIDVLYAIDGHAIVELLKHAEQLDAKPKGE